MRVDQIKDYAILRGENVIEVQDVLIETALEYAYSYCRTRLEELIELPYDFIIAVYGIYKQLSSSKTLAYTGFEMQQGSFSYKSENDIPYNSRRILDNYRFVGFF